MLITPFEAVGLTESRITAYILKRESLSAAVVLIEALVHRESDLEVKREAAGKAQPDI